MSFLYVLFGFKLNRDVYFKLAAERLPQATLDKLREIEDVPFRNKASLNKSLNTLLSKDEYGSFSLRIIEAARVLNSKRLFKAFKSIYALNVADSKFILPISRYILSLPVFFTIWFRSRYWCFWVLSKVKNKPFIKALINENTLGFEYNKKQMQCFYRSHREQTEGLMGLFKTITHFDIKSSKILAVGPRNETEVLLLRLHGFERKNISSIDLFSYSPAIDVMDMNAMDYPDDSFDAYYSAAVIRYSSDVKKTVEEAIRVVKDGGLMAYCFTFGTISDIVPEGAEFTNGQADLMALYGDSVDHVYWQQEHVVAAGDTRVSVIFSIKK